AGAKFYRAPLAYYGTKYWPFARRYIDSVLMGQTQPGSFVVTAFVPVNESVPLSASQEPGFSDLEGVTCRDITFATVQALSATRQALEESRGSGTIVAFTDRGVESGISYELVNVVKDIASGTSHAEVSVSWDPSQEPQDSADAHVAFAADDVPILER